MMETRHEEKDLHFLNRARNLLGDALMYVDSVSLRGHETELVGMSDILAGMQSVLFELRNKVKKELA